MEVPLGSPGRVSRSEFRFPRPDFEIAESMVFLELFAIVLLGISPLLLWLGQRWGLLSFRGLGFLRFRADERSPQARWHGSDRPRSRLFLDPQIPEQRYVEGVGVVVGDLSCEFNACSPQLRCAVNPMGPCQDCPYYQAKSWDSAKPK